MSAAVDTARAATPATSGGSDKRAPWVLTTPALMLFFGALVIPLAMTNNATKVTP